MKDALITIKTVQNGGGEDGETKIVTVGKYEKTPFGCRFTYNETDATGFEGSTTTFRIWDGDDCRLEMVRSGSYQSELYVDKDKKSYSVYSTPFGEMTVGIQANRFCPKLDENGGTVDLSYVMDINSSLVGRFEMEIEIEGRGQKSEIRDQRSDFLQKS